MTATHPPRLVGFFLALFLLQAVTITVVAPGMLMAGTAAASATR